MAAYMIVFAHIHDRDGFIAAYAAPTAELIKEFGGEYLVRTPKVAILENAPMLKGYSAVISRWPDRAAIDAFWNSEAYARLKALRQTLADAHVMVVET